VQLGRQLRLTGGRAADDPGEDDAQDPDAHRELERVLDQARRHRCEHGEQAQRDRRRERGSPAPDDEGEDRHVEHEWFKRPGALSRDNRDDHPEGQRRHGKAAQVGPCGKGRDRERGENEVARGPGIGYDRDDRDREREDRRQHAQQLGPRRLRR
jgi:hypothetical protein